MPALTPKLSKEYDLLYASCLIRPKRQAAVDQIVRQLRANKPRYQKVARALKIPWYVVGIIHNMEAGMSFGGHLHNGDPLTARTTHVPAGRPKTGRPPFTWEASAIDALTMQGFDKWKDWSAHGTLYKLEAYNGWGYRMKHPQVLSPYLWSFSNHYTRGKYVADGSFSATAVSAQCGAAVLLKRLTDAGRIAVPTGPRVLQLSNPPMIGPDVEEAQRLLKRNVFGSFDPGKPDKEFGELTAGAVRQAKWALGYPPKDVNATYGPQVKLFLSGKKPLPPAFQKRRAKRLQALGSEAAIRKKIVSWARWGCKNTGRIGYSQDANLRLAALGGTAGALPLATDCSAFATLCYAWAGAPNPNATGPFDPRQPAFTGSMLDHCRRIPRTAARPGDLVVWTPPRHGQHVCIVVANGADPMLVSHGDSSGPKLLRFSAEDRYQRTHGHGTAVFLSAF
jgi:lysozyme family protein